MAFSGYFVGLVSRSKNEGFEGTVARRRKSSTQDNGKQDNGKKGNGKQAFYFYIFIQIRG